jgi:hypothetical protein
MKTSKNIFYIIVLYILCSTVSSCSMYNSVFGPKYGCPSNGRNVGAERILSGEKVPKAPKFKA